MLQQAIFSNIIDYYPFGMVTQGRSYSAGSGYRFGYNGQEQVDEVHGNGNLNTAEYWEFDTRIGRRWNTDPVVKYFESPYSALANNPILYIDPDGRDTITFTITTNVTKSNSYMDNYPSQPAITQSEKIDIKVNDSPDVFYYNTITTTYGADGNLLSELKFSTKFDPINNNISGVTSTKSPLDLATVQDRSQVTLGKIAPDWLLDYLIESSDYNSKEWLAYKSAQYYSKDYELYSSLKLVSDVAFSIYGSYGLIKGVFSAGSNTNRIFKILNNANSGSGYFGLGVATYDDAMTAGKAWVGDGYTVASDGKTLVSSDGLRQFRPPTYKPKEKKLQANFESRKQNKGRWDNNGHLDIQ